MDDYDECKERRDAELEFVESAYAPDEAWSESRDGSKPPIIIRKLKLQDEATTNDSFVMLSMRLTMPLDYPVHSELGVEVSLDQDGSSIGGKNATLIKYALSALPSLNSSCRSIAIEHQQEESVFLVFSQADEWIQDEWPKLCKQYQQKEGGRSKESSKNQGKSQMQQQQESNKLVLGRRLIYSHHIISKIKRGDIKSLASHYKLTGYMKIGWPGLLIFEGLEENCIAFYDDIRPWNWQYLVLRGEQQEVLPKCSSTGNIGDDVLQSYRKFDRFLEVEDMSLVARHCREVGLENLFRTSMKVYDNVIEGGTSTVEGEKSTSYGAIVHVDHMNNGKGYRKWLRKTSQETHCNLLIKQSHPNQDYSTRPKIVVGIVGESREQVGGFMKRWRTSKVDHDARKIPCYERKMSIVVEGDLPFYHKDIDIDWNQSMSEENVNLPEEQVAEHLQSIGGDEWEEAWWTTLRGGSAKSGKNDDLGGKQAIYIAIDR